jgi:hypothetical protein
VNYARYVDDTLLIYDSQHTDLHSILHDFNSLHQNLHFTGETEHNNTISYLDITIHKTPSILPQKTNPQIPPHPQSKPTTQSWTIFTYKGKETTYITKLFRHTNIKIAYRTNNNLLRHLTPNPQPLDPSTHSGVYRLSCPDCSKAYIGQTGRTSEPDITNRREPSNTIPKLPNTRYMRQHSNTHLATYKNTCKVCTPTTKAPTSILSKNSTSLKRLPLTTT